MSKKRGKSTTHAKPDQDVVAESENPSLPVMGKESVVSPEELKSFGGLPEETIEPDKALHSADISSVIGNGPSADKEVSETADSLTSQVASTEQPPASHTLDSSDSAEAASSQPAATPPKSVMDPADQTPQPPAGSRLYWLSLLLAVLACVGIAALVYMDRDIQHYLEHRNYPDTDQRLSAELRAISIKVDESVSSAERLQAELGSLSGLGATQGQLRSQIVDTRKQLQESTESLQRQLQELQQTSRSDWLLAEVEYLLRLANQRLLTEGDLRGVEALLVSADTIIRDLDNVSLHPVREALANDLAAIRAVPALDEEGIYLQLAALSQQVMKLPSMPAGGFQVVEVPVDAETLDQTSVWQRMLTRAMAGLERFKEYFRLNANRSQPLQELMTPDQEVYLRQNLRLMMEQSQLAVLKRQQGIYDTSLAASLDWLRRYFSYNSQVAQSMISQLEELQSVELDPQLPDISSSLKAVKEFNEALHRRKETAS